ncbi:MAG: hypothetical protein LHW55_02985 [Candidatus Cloacimonetes bacterium]|nr:hypothetical protein [Candidatus Cloacimonadota bacterium]
MEIQSIDKLFWLQLITAIAALLTAVVALFQDRIKTSIIGPNLKISVNETPDRNQNEHGEQIWYYHLDICNKSSTIAKNTRVILTKIDEIKVGGLRQVWIGAIPLTWMYEECEPAQSRDIGSQKTCDIFAIGENIELNLMVSQKRKNFPESWKNQIALRLTINVRYDQSSFEQELDVLWDGEWEYCREEMVPHVKIQIDPDKIKPKKCK